MRLSANGGIPLIRTAFQVRERMPSLGEASTMPDVFIRFAGEKPTPDKWRVGVTLGNNALRRGRPEDALTYFLKTLRDYGKDNPLVKGVVGNGLGAAYTMVGAYAEAALFLRNAFTLNLQRSETDPTDAIESMTNLGRLALMREKSDKALAWLEEGLEYAKGSKNQPGVTPCSPQVEFKLEEEAGYAYYEADQMPEAAEHLERAVEIGIKKLRNPKDKGVNRQMANLQYFLAELYLEQEKTHCAEATAEEALEYAKRVHPPDSTHLIRYLQLNREIMEIGGRFDEADAVNEEIARVREAARLRKQQRRENPE